MSGDSVIPTEYETVQESQKSTRVLESPMEQRAAMIEEIEPPQFQTQKPRLEAKPSSRPKNVVKPNVQLQVTPSEELGGNELLSEIQKINTQKKELEAQFIKI